MAGILFSPGQDPFSSFGRGYETSIANLLAMEREQRQRDEDAWLKKQRAGYDTAADAIANANTDPRFFSADPSVVQGGNLDALARSSGSAPADEWGTDTTGMAGQAMRRPETYAEMGIKPGAAIQMEKWFPQARQTLGILTPQQQVQQQKEQAAIAKKQQLLLHPPTREEDVVPWIGQYSAVDGQASEKMIGYMIDKATQNPSSVQKVIGAYSQKYQEGLRAGLSPTAAMDQAKQGLLQGVSSGELSLGATTQAEGIIKPLEPRSETPGTQGLADVNKVMQQYPIVETPESVTDIYQKLMRIGTKPAMDEAAKLRPRITELVKEAHPTMANIPDNVIYGIANGDLPPIKLSDGTVFGKDQAARLKGTKVQVAEASGEARGRGFMASRPASLYDSKSGHVIKTDLATAEDLQVKDPDRYLDTSDPVFRANTQELVSLQTQRGKISSFMRTADQNLALAEKLSDAVSRSDMPALNKLILNYKLNVEGDTPTAKYKAAMLIAQRETARVLSSATGTGVITQEAQRDLEDVSGGKLSPSQVKGVFSTFRKDMQNREKGYNDQIGEIHRRLGLSQMDQEKQRQRDTTPPQTGTPSAPSPSGKTVQVGGDTLPDPTGLKDGRRAGPYVIRNGQWVKE